MKITSFLISIIALTKSCIDSKINEPQESRQLGEVFQLKLWWERGMEWQQYSKGKVCLLKHALMPIKKTNNLILITK